MQSSLLTQMAKKKSKLAAVAKAQKESAIAFNEFERVVLNATREATAEEPHVNLKYYSSSYQCFSEWEPGELKALSALIEKLRQHKWSDIYKTGGQVGNKTGLAYTLHKDRAKLPRHPALDSISEDITFFELRVDQEMRVHGFRCLEAFYLVWLDRKHEVYS